MYPIDAVAKLDPGLLRRHFLRGSGTSDGLVRVRPELGAMITFRQLNLLQPRGRCAPASTPSSAAT